MAAAQMREIERAVASLSLDEELDHVFLELVEEEILEHSPAICANRCTGGALPRVLKRSELRNWSMVAETMSALAFSTTSGDPWHILGIPKGEGPTPTIEIIERRAHLATLFAKLRTTTTWQIPDVERAAEFERRVETARSACGLELPQVLRERRKHRDKAVPRWQEPSTDFFNFVHERAKNDESQPRVALHLSNLQGVDFQAFPHALTPPECRNMYDQLYGGVEKCTEFLQQHNGTHLIIWGPTEGNVMQQLATAYSKFIGHPESTLTLKLLIPHDVYPGCETEALIRDLWWHPLLGDKWRSIVSQVEFFRQPTRCVFTGSVNPLYHIKSLAMFTLSTTVTAMRPSLTLWRPTLLNFDNGFAITVDSEAEGELAMRRAVAPIRLPGLLGWVGPRRGLGSKGRAQRSVLAAYFDKATVTELDLHLYIRILKETDGLHDTLVGSHLLFTDSSFLLVDVDDPQALKSVAGLIDEVVLASPKLANIRTTKAATVDDAAHQAMHRQPAEYDQQGTV
jgi:hypothetical protein